MYAIMPLQPLQVPDVLAVEVVQVQVELPCAGRRLVGVLQQPLKEMPLRQGGGRYHDQYSFLGSDRRHARRLPYPSDFDNVSFRW